MSTIFSSCAAINGEPLFTAELPDSSTIAEVFGRARQAAFRFRRVSIDQRIAWVRRYAEYLTDHRDEIRDLISLEVGKLPWDADAEVSASISKIELSIAAFQQRRSDHVIQPQPGSIQRHIRYRPIGIALVLGPFNFPLHLPGGQIVPLLIAGNAVVLKPSEQATAVGDWMLRAWNATGLPDDTLQMIVGGTETAITAIDSPDVDGVFLTGSRQAGLAIHRQLAGRPEVMLALEMGGNNPVVVAADADPLTTANLVSFSAFVSAGQRCTCARRAIFVDSPTCESQITALVDSVKQLRVGLPVDASAQVGPVISEAAATTLHQTYQRLVSLGCNPLVPWQVDDRFPSLVHPAILDASGLTDQAKRVIADLEWFGPMLVIDRVGDFDAAVQLASETPYGLAASLIGGTEMMFEQFVNEVRAGVVNWNGPTTGAAGVLPFGGIGASGNHRPAGYHAIDFCSDPIASLQRSEPVSDDPWSIVK
ncbi:aldehyde dehydrogenase family protein [Rubripirellula reticaptiva]|uniref:L-glutamate gamma-semialdehyde dehydrogenase n=1 Tax=Rubripirellula reticaptiva TaxID=2528013 RepID=A0A5C6F6S9_9BACT|nr:aldehyde dehydrogenase family protein [Rubripirellula reticaptiva]TWU55796.1 N-succinylglutamate 5-semialdehyde dehydrogenase [Rubripirellula reticaptiva]